MNAPSLRPKFLQMIINMYVLIKKMYWHDPEVSPFFDEWQPIVVNNDIFLSPWSHKIEFYTNFKIENWVLHNFMINLDSF
jgi:hypothetical protein